MELRKLTTTLEIAIKKNDRVRVEDCFDEFEKSFAEFESEVKRHLPIEWARSDAYCSNSS